MYGSGQPEKNVSFFARIEAQMNIEKNTKGKWVLELDDNELKVLYSNISYTDDCRVCPYSLRHHSIGPKCQIENPDYRPCNYIWVEIRQALKSARSDG